MARTGGFNCEDMRRFQRELERLQQNTDAFLEECAKELAARLLRKVIKRTPVGQYPEGSGKTGGTLRRGWTTAGGAIEVNHFGDTYVIEITNPVEYANDLTAHTGNNNVHVTIAEKSTWNGKANANHTHSEYAANSHTHSEYAPIDSPNFTTAISMGRVEGSKVGSNSVAIGDDVEASGYYSHAEGYGTKAEGTVAHAEGWVCVADGNYSHAEGYYTNASGNWSHAEGYHTKSLGNQHAQGHYNDTSLALDNSNRGTSTGTAFVVGNGTDSTPSNAFRVTGNGQAIGKASFAATGADYAEYFEWADGNTDNEDRVGYFVTFADGKTIQKANEGDYILGIVSGMPCVIGNNDEGWMKQFEMDEWGRFIYETYTGVDEKTGEEYEYTHYKTNPEYDVSKDYVHREKRPEWSAIGMVGVLSVRDDGSCQVNGYCKCSKDGIATTSETGYRVIERVSDNIVKVVLK